MWKESYVLDPFHSLTSRWNIFFSRRDIHGCKGPSKYTRKFLEGDYFSVLILLSPLMALCLSVISLFQGNPYFYWFLLVSCLSYWIFFSGTFVFFFSFTVKFWVLCVAFFFWITTPFCGGLRHILFWRQMHRASLLVKIGGFSKGQPRILSLGSKDAHQCGPRDIAELERFLIRGIAFLTHEEMRMGTRPQGELGYPQ